MTTENTMDERQRRLRLAVAALLVLLAGWLAWGGWGQWQDAQRESALIQTRNATVEGVQRAVAAQRKRLDDAMQGTTMRAALAAGDSRATEVLRQEWPELEGAELLPADVAPLYADPAATGYGRLAAIESALAERQTVARVASIDGEPRLVLAAPVVGEGAVGTQVLLAVLPVTPVTAPLQGARLPGASFLALRQGSHALAEQGETALASSAEARAKAVPGTDLRVAAAVPEPVQGAFGLGAVPSLALAAVLLALAAVVAATAFGLRLKRRRAPQGEEAVTEALTLEQALEQAPEAPANAGLATPVVDAGAPEQTVVSGIEVDPAIFRAYDIRGVVGQGLDRDVAACIGQAIGTLMAEQGLDEIVVGRDGRLSGPDMVDGLVEGLRDAGRNVIDIGLAPTPVVYFGTFHLRTGCGVAVTGSHNPPDYNGFKIVVGGTTLAGEAITDLYRRISEGRLHRHAERGTLSQRDIGQDYIDRIAGDIQLARPLTVVVDAGNGVAGDIGPRVLEAVGAQVVPLYCEIDGTFPNHHPDPSEPHNLEDLVQTVARTGADLGLAFDGDGDRLGVVTPAGENIFPDRLLMLFAEDVLERNPGAMIIYDVKCSGRIGGHILRHGGSPLMWKTGHSLVKAKMRETDAELAGEMSGHFFFGERWYGFDDGIYAAARLLEILAQRDEEPGAVLAALPDGVSTPEIKVPAPAGNPHAFVDAFREAARFEDASRTEIDGLRVDWRDGWGLVRASNTTPVLVLRFDADSGEALARIQGAFREQLLAVDPTLDLPF
ncbi:MAG: phosphomannomutase/phosphoglucomutase [Pseudoxanthomonas suwonensis]|nr:phosphomannomutase/phosphoglucomutase [Pseudoxanthomonas suwonensis]